MKTSILSYGKSSQFPWLEFDEEKQKKGYFIVLLYA